VESGDAIRSRSRSTVAHVDPSPLGALHLSGGLLEFPWDADHQTLEEAFDEAVGRDYVISRESIGRCASVSGPQFCTLPEDTPE
jgi:hypothetical protein